MFMQKVSRLMELRSNIKRPLSYSRESQLYPSPWGRGTNDPVNVRPEALAYCDTVLSWTGVQAFDTSPVVIKRL